MSTNKITIRGKTYDLDDVDALPSIQAALVPDNWPLAKAAGVKLFLSLQNMLALEFRRHLASNFKGAIKAAVEEGEEAGGRATIGLAFAFEIDITAPQVAAISKTQMGYSVKHSTKGKPKTHDLTQGEFLGDDLSVVLDVKGFEKENAAPPDEPAAPAGDPPAGDPAAEPPAGADSTVDKPKRGKPKSGAKA